MPHRYSVGSDQARTRLDRFLVQASGLSRTQSQVLIRAGQAWVDRLAITDPAYLVKPGQGVKLRIPPPEPSQALPQPMELDIIFEDADVLVLNKPPGLVTHLGAGK